jgi:hypothetical protein
MKKMIRLITKIFLAVSLITVSCDLPQEMGGGEGSLTVVLPGGSMDRSVLPNSMLGTLKYSLKFTKNSGGSSPITVPEVNGGTYTINLAIGGWTIDVEAYDSFNVLVGTGTESATVTAGQQNHITILMHVDSFYEAALTDIYIHNEAELRRIGTDFSINGGITAFYLESDITLTQPWTPIGDSATPFSAVFDGRGHTVTVGGGFDPAALTNYELGLFGYADGAEIKNLDIVWNMGSISSPAQLPMPNYVPSQTIGGLAGTLDNVSKVENVSVRGSFCFNQTGSTDGLLLGGIAGMVMGGSEIQLCSVSDAVIYGNSAATMRVGGVAGSSDDGASIKKSSFAGTVKSGGSAGGIAGSSSDTLISECHASGTITGVERAGGIAGEFESTFSIAASSFTGTVSGDSLSSDSYAGGVVGWSPSGSIERCYAAGNVEARSASNNAYAGGIAGLFGDSISDCYAYTNIHADGSAGSFAGGIAGDALAIARCYAAGTVKAEGSGIVYAGGISGQVNDTGGHTGCIVLLDALDGGSSADVHTLFGGVYMGTAANTNNKVWGDIAITQSGNIYKNGTASPLSGYSPDTVKDASFDFVASFQGSSSQATYTGAGWNFTAGTGVWKWIGGYDYPVLSWQTAAPDS